MCSLCLQYNFKKKNDTAVRDEAVEIANLLDGVRFEVGRITTPNFEWISLKSSLFSVPLQYYKPLNIRIVLMGLEIFKEENPFSVEGSAGDVLGHFVKWRKNTLIPKIKHDIGQLIVWVLPGLCLLLFLNNMTPSDDFTHLSISFLSGKPESYGGVLGMAFVGTVCSVATSGGINVVSSTSFFKLLTPADTVVLWHHELLCRNWYRLHYSWGVLLVWLIFRGCE